MVDESEPRLFDRIYLDSVPLTASRWPHVSAALRNLLELAADFKLPVIIPAPVDWEQEAQFQREYVGAQKRFRDAYRKAVAAAKDREHIQTIPLTSCSLEELFRLLLNRERPFDEKGRGLGDAVILFSVIDDLRARNERGVLVTGDGDYSKADS